MSIIPLLVEIRGGHATLSVEGTNKPHGFAKQPKKRVRGLDDESGEDRGLSRSEQGSRKLNESVRSGTFEVDEGNKERFEEKCRRLDGYVKFNYEGGWHVRHSKCSKWVKMREPYNVVRFGEHIERCKQTGEKGRNGTIDLFSERRGVGETKMTRMRNLQRGSELSPALPPNSGNR